MGAPTKMGDLLRVALNSPAGRSGEVRGSRGDPFPLPLPEECGNAMRAFLSEKRSGEKRSNDLVGSNQDEMAPRPSVNKLRKASLQSLTA